MGTDGDKTQQVLQHFQCERVADRGQVLHQQTNTSHLGETH